MKPVLIILMVLVMIPLVAKDLKTADGEYWCELDEDQKVVFVHGYILGICVLSEGLLYEYENIMDGVLKFGLWNISTNEIVLAIDIFYNTPDNMGIPLYVVPQWLKSKGILANKLKEG